MDEIKSVIEGVCQELFSVNVSVELTRPDEQFGDFATNIALKIGNKLGKNPREVAEQIAENVRGRTSHVEQVEVAGPGFINLRINSAYLAQIVMQRTKTGALGHSEIGKGKTVVTEFPSPNMAKPYSVGHLRSATQGWAIYRLMERMGYRVITDNHIGDYGTPYGKWVVGFLKFSSEDQLKDKGIYELARVYIETTAALRLEKEHGSHELADEVQSWLKKLESGDPEAIRFSETFNQLSRDHMHHVMERLEIKTEFELGETFYVQRGQELVDELLAKGIAEISEGAVIVRLDEFGIDTPVMLRKSNGAALYATTDLATIEYREKQWSPAKVFIHTGQEQAFYFKQLKALAVKAGYQDVIQHLWHGLIDQKDLETGKREKMSSRKGVVLLEELLDAAEAKAREAMKEGDDTDIKAVALGAIKFTDFTADRKNGVLFDWENMFSVQGFSGPAVQYAAVRIKSILAKTETAEPNDEYDWKTEHKLLLELTAYDELLLELHETYELHKLAAYLYALARQLNRYYEEVRILDSEEPGRSSRLWLIARVGEVITDGLDILGIPTPNRM